MGVLIHFLRGKRLRFTRIWAEFRGEFILEFDEMNSADIWIVLPEDIRWYALTCRSISMRSTMTSGHWCDTSGVGSAAQAVILAVSGTSMTCWVTFDWFACQWVSMFHLETN